MKYISTADERFYITTEAQNSSDDTTWAWEKQSTMGSIPGRWLSRNIGQLSLATFRGR